MKKTVEGEGIVGLQAGGHAVGPNSVLSAALHFLVHPLERRKAAAEARAETRRKRGPDHGSGLAGSPMEAGITGGFSLLMGDPNARGRR